MLSFAEGLVKLIGLIVLTCGIGIAQEIPDAPTPKVPAASNNPFPDAPPAPKNSHPAEDPPNSTPLPDQPAEPKQNADGVVTGRDQLPLIRVKVSFVEVPVTVKDRNGRLVEGLSPRDFTVYEDGVPQKLSFFSSDPFPLSAAIVVDSNLPAGTMKKVNETLPALVGAFSQFDEVALYSYGNSVQRVTNFAGATEVSTSSLEHLKRKGQEGGPPVLGGPLGPQGPSINNHPVDPSAPHIYTPPRESYVLNDAILRAAQDLAKREKAVRRRIIFVISDGREYGSTARYDEVRKILLTQNISVYALGVDTAALPVYDRLNRVRLPGFGYGDILPKYASDTGGDTFAEFDRQSIEQAYAKITEVARNQYTLGYNTKATASSAYRSIDVHVHRPDLMVTAKTGYYSLPPTRQ
jgi:VWFA-related protein